MTREPDKTDLEIHRMIQGWAIKYHIWIGPAALEELEHALLRPVFQERDGLHRALANLIDAVAGEQEDPEELEKGLGKAAIPSLAHARSLLTNPTAGCGG